MLGPESLIFSLVKERPSNLLPTSLYLLHKTQLAELLDYLLVLFLLSSNLMLFQLLLPFLLLLLPCCFLMLLYLLYKQSASDASTPTVLSGSVLDQVSPEGIVLFLSTLEYR